MKILFISDATGLSGGIKQLYYNMVGLHGRGCEIYLAAKKDASIFQLASTLLADALPVAFDNLAEAGKRIAGFARQNRIEIIHSFHNKGGKAGVWSRKHDRSAVFYINRGVSFVPRNPYYVLHPAINGFICNSHAVAGNYRRFWVSRKKINVIYNAFVPAETQFHTDQSDFRPEPGLNVCSVTSGSKWKGNETLLTAFNELPDIDANLYLFGLEPRDEFVRRLLPERRNRVHFMGRRRDIPKLLSFMNIFAYSPVDGDSCPNVILEAFAAGLPVVSTRVGGIPEIVRDEINGYTVPRRKPSELAGKIRQLALNPELRGKITANNRHDIDYFTLARKTDNLMRVYAGETVVESIPYK